MFFGGSFLLLALLLYWALIYFIFCSISFALSFFTLEPALFARLVGFCWEFALGFVSDFLKSLSWEGAFGTTIGGFDLGGPVNRSMAFLCLSLSSLLTSFF
jgi:hypothetical protein